MLISNAYAQAAAGATTSDSLMGLLPIVIMFVILWVLMIRPQMKKAKEHTKMVGELQKGDEIVTQGGVAGRIVKIGESFMTLEVSEGKAGPIEIVVQKNAIGALLPKGTLKSL